MKSLGHWKLKIIDSESDGGCGTNMIKEHNPYQHPTDTPYKTRKAILKFIISLIPTESMLFSTQAYNHFSIICPELHWKLEALCAHHFLMSLTLAQFGIFCFMRGKSYASLWWGSTSGQEYGEQSWGSCGQERGDHRHTVLPMSTKLVTSNFPTGPVFMHVPPPK